MKNDFPSIRWPCGKARRHLVASLVIFAICSVTDLWACGPFFPNSVLLGGDEALLAAPTSSFQRELNRIKLAPVAFKALPPTNGLAQQTYNGELADLHAALAKSTLPEPDQGRLLVQIDAVRRILQKQAEAVEQWRERNAFRAPDESPVPGPQLAPVTLPAGLPAEFADYLEGSIAFHAGDTNAARRAWERVLDRPQMERPYRSTWAAFMLGKTWLQADPDKAVRYFEQVRQLAQAGFADSLGLAAASYGWQAKVELERSNYAAAIRLYLLQYQTGDPTAPVSLRWVTKRLLASPQDGLESAARDSLAQQVVTAHIISRPGLTDLGGPVEATELIQHWLEAVERAGVKDMRAADRLALAAYQRGLFEQAAKWLEHSPHSAMAHWLRAKLLLRAGKVDEAARLLSQVTRLFPREGDWPSPPVQEVAFSPGTVQWDENSPVRRSMGELGLLHLARREYYQALDTLLRSGYWSDAAYIAEYVLSPDELMAYVDRQWPAPDSDDGSGGAESKPRFGSQGMVQPEATTTEIRYLVARRLARLQRWNEALDFYPSKWRARFDRFVRAIEQGHGSGAVEERARALWEAAQIARHEGLELFGTEVEPDWHLFGGAYDWEHISAIRGQPRLDSDSAEFLAKPNLAGLGEQPVQMQLSASTPDERSRLDQHRIKPDVRFHYRYRAADLAWEAAQLLPDNSEETARVLWTAGSWLKNRDPKAADRFYKALVRRCGRTALGQEADRLRWFPKTAAPQAPSERAPPSPSDPPEKTEPGSEADLPPH